MPHNANFGSLMCGVYDTARAMERSTAYNMFLTKRLLLILGLNDVCAPCTCIKRRHGRIEFARTLKTLAKKKNTKKNQASRRLKGGGINSGKIFPV